MRIIASEPEAKWFVGRDGLEEFGEVVEFRSGGIAVSATGLEVSWAPAFSHISHNVTGLLQQIGINGKFLWQKSPEAASLFQAVRVLAGQHRRPRRRAG